MDDTMTVQGAFQKCFGGKSNFMTSEVDAYGRTDSGRVWELSHGEGFDPGDTFWGVTVINADGTRIDKDDPSAVFHTRALAMRHIAKLA